MNLVYNIRMGFHLANPDEPSIKPVESKLAVLPKQESRRIRRAARDYADTLIPTAMQGLAEALVAEDWDVRWKAIDRVLKMTMSGLPNEVVDPDEVVVDSTAKESEALKALESETEKGTGLPDE